MIIDRASNPFGTTFYGGASGNGSVFKLAADGTELLLYSFTGGSDGGNPFAGFIRDKAGNFYSTASAGGASGNGVVFELKK